MANHLLVRAKPTFDSPIDIGTIFNDGLAMSAARPNITSVVSAVEKRI